MLFEAIGIAGGLVGLGSAVVAIRAGRRAHHCAELAHEQADEARRLCVQVTAHVVELRERTERVRNGEVPG